MFWTTAAANHVSMTDSCQKSQINFRLLTSVAFAGKELLQRVMFRNRTKDARFEILIRGKTRQPADEVRDAALPVDHPEAAPRCGDEADLPFDHFGPNVIRRGHLAVVVIFERAMRVPGCENLDTARIEAGTATITSANTAAGTDQFTFRISPEQTADFPFCREGSPLGVRQYVFDTGQIRF